MPPLRAVTRRVPGARPPPESNSTWPDPDPNNATTVTSADGAVPVGNNADTAVPTNGTSTVAAADDTNASAPQNKLPAIPEGSTTEPAVPTAANDVPVVDATPVEQSNTSNQDQQANNTAAPVDTPPVTAPAPPAVVAVTVPTPPAVVDTPSARHDDFPPLASPGREVMESHADKRKKNKEKGKAKAKAAAPTAEPDLVMLDAPPAAAIARDYDEEADRNRGHARSLGLQTDVDAVGASSSRRAATTHATPDSPPKRQRADTAGRAIPTRGGGGGDVERPAARRRYYGTVDQLPPRGNFTPVPRGGFNRPVGITSRSLYRNLPPVQMSQWVEQDHPKLTAHISGGNGDRIQTARRVAQMIADRFNMDPAEILVGPPGLAAGPGPDPIAWLIGGIPLEQAHILADEGMLASDGTAVFFSHFVPPISGFLGTFHGLTVAESNDQLARAILADAITDDPLISRNVRAHRDAYPVEMNADEVYARWSESIHVLPLELRSTNGTFTAWNVYVTPHTDNEDVFEELRGIVSRLVVNTPFNGQAHIYRALFCHICHGTDHPTNLCPYPYYPGWMGPTPETIGALEDASRDAIADPKKRKGKNNQKGNGKGFRDGRDGRDGDRKGGNRRK
ncbi:hypothetical protein B0H11DRAFT_2264661 [Mycena galericulata]|nr:hypothetical protein B0H11DRAFT_2264661 [Mycena galericulata]